VSKPLRNTPPSSSSDAVPSMHNFVLLLVYDNGSCTVFSLDSLGRAFAEEGSVLIIGEEILIS
jgi:hypothetical protein